MREKRIGVRERNESDLSCFSGRFAAYSLSIPDGCVFAECMARLQLPHDCFADPLA